MDSKLVKKPSATLTVDNKQLELPVYGGSVGPDAIDIRKLYSDGKVFTYDPGFTSTASCESQITYIDGDEGVLLYRGYPIDQLAEHSSFLEVCYLLANGELPNKAELDRFTRDITYHTMLHAQFDRFFEGFRRDAHPMAIMVGTVGALAAFYHDSTDIDDPAATHDRQPPPDRQNADDRRARVQIFDRPALHQPAQRTRLCLELPAHVLCGAGRGLQDQSGAGEGDGWVLHPARRPRAERLDLDGAAGGLLRRQPVRLHLLRHRLPVGPSPWRRQRSGAENAAGDRHAWTTFPTSSPG